MKTQSRTLADSKGYTLLEVMLFLAISSALALIAFLGLGPRLRNVRFTDATRAIQSDITKEIINSEVGVTRSSDGFKCVRENFFGDQPRIDNSPGNTSGSSDQCVINGKLAFILNDRVDYHSIVSLRTQATNRPGCQNPAESFEFISKCYRPRIPRQFNDKEKVLVRSVNNKSGLVAESAPTLESIPTGFGYIQSPSGSSRYFFVFKGTSGDSNGMYDTQFVNSAGVMAGGNPVAQNSWEITADKKVCLRLSGREAVLIFKPGAQEPELKSERCS